jgi:hypothetical protein
MSLSRLDGLDVSYRRNLIERDLLIQLHNVLQYLHLKQRGFVGWIDPDRLGELVLGLSIASNRAHNQAPNYPVVCVVGIYFYCLLDLLDSLGHLSLLEQGKRPVTIAVGSCQTIRRLRFSSVTDVYGLLIVFMHVVNECQVVVRIRVPGVDLDADLEVLNRHAVLLVLEV